MYFLIFFRCASVVWVVVHVDGQHCTVLHFVQFFVRYAIPKVQSGHEGPQLARFVVSQYYDFKCNTINIVSEQT